MRLVNPVALIILNEKDDLILLAKRSNKLFGFKGTWSIPGGHVKSGETFEQGLHREISEELGCDILDYTYFKSTFSEIEETQARTVYFYGHLSSDIKLKKDELSESKWFSLNGNFLSELKFAYKQDLVLKEFIEFKKQKSSQQLALP